MLLKIQAAGTMQAMSAAVSSSARSAQLLDPDDEGACSSVTLSPAWVRHESNAPRSLYFVLFISQTRETITELHNTTPEGRHSSIRSSLDEKNHAFRTR